jgi:heme A synthase
MKTIILLILTVIVGIIALGVAAALILLVFSGLREIQQWIMLYAESRDANEGKYSFLSWVITILILAVVILFVTCLILVAVLAYYNWPQCGAMWIQCL